jgi:hypothetical protein
MEKQIIEINGIKMEVDLRHAKRIDHMVVGTKVKLLAKGNSYSSTEVHSGVVVGFEPFESPPTIIVCYLKVDYSSAELKFAYINKETALSKIDRELEKKRAEIEDMERKRDYFLRHFNTYFEASA